jgi:hypothetical protein
MGKNYVEFDVYCSYSQLYVYDVSQEAVFRWTDAHARQGFARQSSAACFRTLIPYGEAHVRAFFQSELVVEQYERVISVPFFAPTGNVVVRGPAEITLSRLLFIGSGNHTLTVAQRVTYDDEEDDRLFFDLFFNRSQSLPAQSRVLVADAELDPPEVLIEDAEVLDE